MNFAYYLLIILLTLVIATSYFVYKKKKMIKDVTINPVLAILSSFFFLSLWLFDLTTLQMGDFGWATTNGTVPGSAAQVPSIFVWGTTFLAMAIITILFYFYNKKYNKKEFHKWLVITMMIGLTIMFLAAITMVFKGRTFQLFGFYFLGIYHAMLPLVMIPNLILSVNTK